MKTTAKTPSSQAFIQEPRIPVKPRRLEPSPEVDLLAHKVISAAIEVHRLLGPGYLESVYEQALTIELGLQGIPFERQVPVAVDYKEHKVGEGRLDLLVARLLPVELKAIDAFAPIHQAQLVSYPKMGTFSLACSLTSMCQSSSRVSNV
jgi:GxxExxY protein